MEVSRGGDDDSPYCLKPFIMALHLDWWHDICIVSARGLVMRSKSVLADSLASISPESFSGCVMMGDVKIDT